VATFETTAATAAALIAMRPKRIFQCPISPLGAAIFTSSSSCRQPWGWLEGFVLPQFNASRPH
jgi:hypothetical protein